MKKCNPLLLEIDHRHELGTFLQKHYPGGLGVESGVFLAGLSQMILSGWSGTLRLVDPYRKFTKAEYFDSTQDRDQEQVFREAKANVASFGSRAQFRRETGLEAAAETADGELDFVYIDSNHKFEAVTEEIAAWWPKVKSGGLFGGHDFYTRLKDTDSDALNAVLDFAESIDTRPHCTWCNSWFFIKP